MRKFTSYGPVDTDLHYHAPRKDLVDRTFTQLIGENPDKGGHYITVWAPRQSGKTWVMQQIANKFAANDDFDVAILTMEFIKDIRNPEDIRRVFLEHLGRHLGKDFSDIRKWDAIPDAFTKHYLKKPLILILDEFDALGEEFINKFASMFRSIYTDRLNEADRPSGKKSCLLHGLALIGVRSVLGIENITGSPFNVQRSLRIPNLTFEEVRDMFQWYEKESGQKIEPDVVERIFHETRGQPGLTCWFGELLTETYNEEKDRPITAEHFDHVLRMAVQALPNNNILNIISKARQEPYKSVVLELFETNSKMVFRYDRSRLNFLYLNGVIDIDETAEELFVRFSNPFVQKRLFGYFSEELFEDTGKLSEPFENLSDTITETGLNISNLMRRFETYLKKNREWLLKDAPRRKDLRIFEAVYHFILYRYLCDFLGTKRAKVWPEFPTGNGKADILIRYRGQTYILEVKSYTDESGYYEASEQAARYGKQMNLPEVTLVFFVEYVDEANREKYEKTLTNEETGVRVIPVFVATGS